MKSFFSISQQQSVLQLQSIGFYYYYKTAVVFHCNIVVQMFNKNVILNKH